MSKEDVSVIVFDRANIFIGNIAVIVMLLLWDYSNPPFTTAPFIPPPSKEKKKGKKEKEPSYIYPI